MVLVPPRASSWTGDIRYTTANYRCCVTVARPVPSDELLTLLGISSTCRRRRRRCFFSAAVGVTADPRKAPVFGHGREGSGDVQVPVPHLLGNAVQGEPTALGCDL